MKRYVLAIVLAGMLFPTAAFSQEPEQMEQVERQFELRNMQLEMAKREAELKFHEEMQQLELEQRRVQIDGQRREFDRRSPDKHKMGPILIVCFIVHILVAIWVYKDLRQRRRGSGLWIVIALLAGLLGTLVYAVVRLGDNNTTKTRK